MTILMPRSNDVLYMRRIYTLGKIEHDLQRQTVAEDPISPAFRLAVCLYRLARGDYFYTIAEMVDKGRSTVSTIVDEKPLARTRISAFSK